MVEDVLKILVMIVPEDKSHTLGSKTSSKDYALYKKEGIERTVHRGSGTQQSGGLPLVPTSECQLSQLSRKRCLGSAGGRGVVFPPSTSLTKVRSITLYLRSHAFINTIPLELLTKIEIPESCPMASREPVESTAMQVICFIVDSNPTRSSWRRFYGHLQ